MYMYKYVCVYILQNVPKVYIYIYIYIKIWLKKIERPESLYIYIYFDSLYVYKYICNREHIKKRRRSKVYIFAYVSIVNIYICIYM